jgi:uncharacterized RDD family membrane protein YckC
MTPPSAALLEPIREALGAAPLLVLAAGDAVLGCGATEIVLAAPDGVQRLDLREIRKVTHLDGQLVVSGDERVLRGAFPVDGADLKAFFADVQTVRKARGAPSMLESRFKPVVSAPVLSSAEIPGFGFGLAASEPAPLSSAPPPEPARVPPPSAQAAPSAAQPDSPPLEPQPPSAPDPALLDADAFFGATRPAKPNPRAGLAPQREQLPPRKADPRAAPKPNTPEPVAPPPSVPAALETPAPNLASSPSPTSPTPVVARPEPAPSPAVSAPPPAARTQDTSSPRPVPERRAAPPKARSAPSQVKLPAFDAKAVAGRIANRARGQLERAGTRGRQALRRLGASVIDLLVTAVLIWAVTRFVGGRELESLLEMPGQSQLDLGLLARIKDLLPLYISGALNAALAATAVGLVYALASEMSPLRATPGKKALGLRLETLTGARPSPAVIAGRTLVSAMLMLVPVVLGLLPTLLALNGTPTALRSTLQLFGISVWVGVVAFLIGLLPVWGGNRDQSLSDYLTDCRVRDA